MRTIFKVLLILCLISLSFQVKGHMKKKHQVHIHKEPVEEVPAVDDNFGSLKDIIDEQLQAHFERGGRARSVNESESLASLAQLPEFANRPYIQK